MDAIAAAHGAPMASLALAWLLRKEVVTSVIVGLPRLKQLDANLAASEIRLTDAEVDTLDAASALAPEYPAWMAASDSARQALLATRRLA